MKNKLITILIIFTMLFSMTIPTFATDGNRETTLMLTGLGDSIASGCVNTDFVSDGGAGAATIGDQDFREFVKFTNGKKNYNCDAVEMSFVSKLYRTFGANQYSKNLAFPGLRAKDFCNIVGLEPLEDGDYYDNWWYVMQSSCTMGLLCNEYNSQVYKSAIKHSDIIVIELGENDMTSTLLNNYEKIVDIFMKISTMMPQDSEERAATEDLAENTEALYEELTGAGNDCKIKKIVEKINKDIEELTALGKGIKEIVQAVTDYYKELITQNRYYFMKMMDYVKNNSKSGAVIVVGTMINPCKDMEDDTGAVKMLNMILSPFISDSNAFIRALANKYGYVVADISEVSLNPGAPFSCHPNEEGQKIIADKFTNAINNVLTDSRKEQLGISVEVKDAKEATYFESGFSGNHVCTDCGEVLLEGKTIPNLRPDATKVKKLKAKTNSITVNWTKTKAVNGYRIQYSTSAKFKKGKKITINKATATSKTINNLKRGTKYYVRVRSYKKVKDENGKTVMVYSKWSAVKSAKTQ